ALDGGARIRFAAADAGQHELLALPRSNRVLARQLSQDVALVARAARVARSELAGVQGLRARPTGGARFARQALPPLGRESKGPMASRSQGTNPPTQQEVAMSSTFQEARTCSRCR